MTAPTVPRRTADQTPDGRCEAVAAPLKGTYDGPALAPPAGLKAEPVPPPVRLAPLGCRKA